MNLRKLCGGMLLVAALLSCGWAGTSSKAADPAETIATAHRGDMPGLLAETQLGIQAPHYTGLIWYIPFEFWVESAKENGQSADVIAQQLKSLRSYTLVMVFAGKVGALGGIDFVTPEELKKKVILRDAQGNDYAPLEEVSSDATNLAAMIKPILANAIGKAGENATLLFFPANGKSGGPIADPLRAGNFSVVLKDVVGVPEDVYEWSLPLTSLSAPKYCPVGKERVKANWKYCPWHGVNLQSGDEIKPATIRSN